jgi:hypothetical protein
VMDGRNTHVQTIKRIDSATVGSRGRSPVPADMEYSTSTAWCRFRVHDRDGNEHSTAARPGIEECGRRQENGTEELGYCDLIR